MAVVVAISPQLGAGCVVRLTIGVWWPSLLLPVCLLVICPITAYLFDATIQPTAQTGGTT